MPTPDETAPLLANRHDKPVKKWLWQRIGVKTRILLVGFQLTLSFSFTQVPYVSCYFFISHFQLCMQCNTGKYKLTRQNILRVLLNGMRRLLLQPPALRRPR